MEAIFIKQKMYAIDQLKLKIKQQQVKMSIE